MLSCHAKLVDGRWKLFYDVNHVGIERFCYKPKGVHSLGYLYAIMPTAVGASIISAVALLVNNIPKTRRYPEFWL